MVAPLVKLLRIASFVICTIVVLSFAAFVIEQSQGASEHQTNEILGKPNSGEADAQVKSGATKKGSVHKALDGASSELTSPFAGVVSGSSSEWVIRGVKLLIALAVYGFGFGYLARTLRVRV
ncbi:MAG TPA: hypothetical protein VK790_14695 [Solirubrobacteraceae bacterium]|nr:hypothetical protein [Solirubrobacteraceae bacterium]